MSALETYLIRELARDLREWEARDEALFLWGDGGYLLFSGTIYATPGSKRANRQRRHYFLTHGKHGRRRPK